MENKKRFKIDSRSTTAVMASLIAILIGLVVGLAVLLIFDAKNAFQGFGYIITAGFSSISSLSKTIYQAVPLICTGLSVAFAFKTGLFNIGASGQYTVGAFFALYGAIVLHLPWYVNIILAMIGGAIWGIFPGLCKAFFNVNEVITSIMFNWIGLYLVNLLVYNTDGMLGMVGNRAKNITIIQTETGRSDLIIPKAGLDKLFDSNRMNVSIFIAVAVAIILYIVLTKTTFGYELRACGFNRDASRYAGISARRSMILSMVIAGAMAGLGGGLYYLSGTAEYVIEDVTAAAGFDGIPVALLASSSPIGVIFSALFVSYIRVGGEALQQLQYSTETINVIIAAIIYLSAFSLLIRGVINKYKSKFKKNVADKTEEAKQ